jgi:hypothetical protein
LLARDLSRPSPAAVLSRADLKSATRLAENQLLNAEKWATLAGLVGARYPDRTLDKAWRLLLYGQHHQALAGRVADLSYLDLLASCRESIELAAEVERRALSYLSLRIATHRSRGAPRSGAALVVFNSLSWSRTDICHALISLEGPLAAGFQLTDDRGRPVAFQITSDTPARPLPEADHPAVEIAFIAADIPSLGYRTYYLRPAPSLPEAEAGKAADTATIENEHFSITANAALGGGLTSLRDKTLNLNLINSAAGPANELLAIAEGPGGDPAAPELDTTGDLLRSRDQRAKLTVTNGPVFSRLHVKSQLGDRCQLMQEVTLYRGLRRIDLRTSIQDYRGAHELLALTFPLALGNPTPIFEDRFAAIVRAPSRGPRDFRMRGLASAQNWMDAGPAPSLWITGADRSRRALPLGPCAIVTSPDLHHRAALPRLLQALLARGITSTHFLDTADPDADSACALRISLGRDNAYSKRVLTGNPQAAARLTEMLSQGPWAAVLVSRPDPSDATLRSSDASSLRSTSPSQSVPTLVAHTSDPGGIPALVEMLATAVAANEVAIPEACDFHKGARPADSHGLALLTGNTFAAALESDNTLVLPLFHTSPWKGHPWGQGKLDHFLIPEHKTHVFRYSLLPHRGDWREAGLVRAGREVSNPLIALEAPLQEGPLPIEFSLVSVDQPDVLITAVKPAGDPLPQQRPARRSLTAADIILRLYEPHGAARTAQLTFPAPPASAWLCDLLEQKTADLTIPRARRRRPVQLPVTLGPCEIATVGLRLSPLLDTPSHPEDLGPSTEPGQPVHSRYWDHNLGAAPLGNQPVTVWMRGVLPRGKNTRFGLGVSNDSLEREITGTVGIVAPATWTLIPRQVPYRIAPGSQAVYEIMVTPPADAPSCFLRAIVQDDDQLFQDVIPIGDVQPLAITLAREESAFLVTVENPNGDYVEGQVVLITPLESWGPAVGRLAVAAVSPRLYAFNLQAGAKQTFRFTIAALRSSDVPRPEGRDGGPEGLATSSLRSTSRGNINSIWAVAKVMWYGNVQYTQAAPPVG